MVAHMRLSAAGATVLHIKKNSAQPTVLFFISSSNLFIKMFFFSGVKKDIGVEILMNVRNGFGRNPWSLTNLCPVVLLWPLRDIWMYVWFPPILPTPHFTLFSRPVLYVLFLIPSVLQENVCHWTLNMCLKDIVFHLRACESVCVERWGKYLSVYRDYGVVFCCFLLRRQIITGQLDPPTFPWPFVPWFCGLNLHACVHFCHTKATSSASAYSSLIPQNAKLELFALFADEYGYSLTCTNCNPHSACIAWPTWKSWSHRYGYIYILLYFKKNLALFTLNFVLLLRVMCVYLHIYEFILLLYIIYLLFQVSKGLSFVKGHAWSLRFVYFCREYLFDIILTL